MTAIPQVIHRLWLGPRPMPQRFREFAQDWRDLNPGWECHDWSWHDLPDDLANIKLMTKIKNIFKCLPLNILYKL